MAELAWIEQLGNSVQKFISVETVDGVIREGKLTGLRLKRVKYNGVMVDTIDELEFNGDPTDCVPLERLIRIDVS